jgi:uncharacterized membrane protein YkvA (DUF1232 family)
MRSIQTAARTRVRRHPVSFARLLLRMPLAVRVILRLLADRRVAVAPKLLILGAVVYVLSPLDLIPELLLPVLGFADDLGLLLLAARSFLGLCPPAVVREHLHALGARDLPVL